MGFLKGPFDSLSIANRAFFFSVSSVSSVVKIHSGLKEC